MSNQLVKKNPAEGYQNVFPKTWIDAIKDKESGVSLQEILQGFNMYFLSYNGSRALTRCKVPSILRKEGLWITYVLYDHTVVTEWYNSDQIDDNSWSMDSNWRVASNNLVGDISVSSDGYWVINGEKTEARAQGKQGVTPLLRVGANNKLQVSYNAGKVWKDISDYIVPRFKWNQGVGTTAGTIQISMDLGKTWTNLSNEITNNLRISRYIGTNESLPTSGVAEGTIYMKGPYYNESDTSHTNPIYRMWVYAWKGNTLAWQDNGEFTSISTSVVQERGNSTTEVMSQDAVSKELSELERKVGEFDYNFDLTPSSSNQYVKLSVGDNYLNLSSPYYLVINSVSSDSDGWRFVEETEDGITNYLVPDKVETLDRYNSTRRISLYLKGGAGNGSISFSIISGSAYDNRKNIESVKADVQANTESITKNASDISSINDFVFDEGIGDEIPAESTESGYILRSDGATVVNTSYTTKKFDVQGISKVYVSGRSAGGNWTLCVAYSEDGSQKEAFFVGMSTDYIDELITLPSWASYIKVCADNPNPKAKKGVNGTSFYKKAETYSKKEIDEKISGDSGFWNGKNIWWCGTSIPYGDGGNNSYPKKVGAILGCANIFNESRAGSMARANVRTGDYNGANIINITRTLSKTKEEVESFISNYNTYKNVVDGAPSTVEEFISQGHASNMRNTTFESLLLPYINGTRQTPDLFVFDHGHNDYKYTLADGSSDMTIQPTRENITNGILAEDTYMTSNNYANLKSWIGDFSSIPSSKIDAFVCSLNRNCFIGAMNFLITLILVKVPKARIVFVGNDSWQDASITDATPIIKAQKSVGDGWGFPLCELYNKLGFSKNVIPNVSGLYSKHTYCPDGVHPHSDTTGKATDMYAEIIADFIKTCR